jgi:hypothetical protein
MQYLFPKIVAHQVSISTTKPPVALGLHVDMEDVKAAALSQGIAIPRGEWIIRETHLGRDRCVDYRSADHERHLRRGRQEDRYHRNPSDHGPSVPKMATFDGKPGAKVDWRAFYMHFQKLADHYQWDEEERLWRLTQSLRDSALYFYSRLPRRAQDNLQELVQRMQSRFAKQDPPTTVRRQIQELRQGKSETLEELAERAQHLSLDAFPHAETAFVDVVATDAFLKGCRNKDAAFAAMYHRPETVDQALERVREATHIREVLYGGSHVKVPSQTDSEKSN